MTRRVVVVASLLASLGCGPIQSTAYLLDAEVQIEAARTAGADKLAPFEWTSANLYIHKARMQVGHSDFEAGVDFAQKASKFARDARDKAMGTSNKGEMLSPATPSK
jgi:hypothetical protein